MNFVTLKQHRHGATLRKVGDEYHIPREKDRVLFLALKWIAPAKPKVAAVAPSRVAKTIAIAAVAPAAPVAPVEPIVPVQTHAQESLLDAPAPAELSEPVAVVAAAPQVDTDAPPAEADRVVKPRGTNNRRDLSAK